MKRTIAAASLLCASLLGASLLGASLLGAAVLAAGCSAPPVAALGRGERRAAPALSAPPASPSPARYVLTDCMGALFDEAGSGSRAPRVEPAIVSSVRVLLDGGVIVASAKFAEPIVGFRSVPKRFGSGYVIWSNARTYRAADFLGELRPIVDVAATGGARPWLGSLLLRTERGVLELDPTSLAVRRAAVPGLADGLALDEKRAVRLDGLGRAYFTVDGGAAWTDALATRGIVTARLEETDDGSIALVGANGKTELRLGREGDIRATPAPLAALSSQTQYNSYGRSRPVSSSAEPPKYGPQPLADRVAELQGTSRTLPSEVLTHAAVAGALLPGEQLLVARDGGLRAIAAQSGRPVADGDLVDVAEPMRHCQPARVGSDVLLACTHDRGSHVMVIRGALDKPELEATFPVAGGFVAGPQGRFGFAGRCGADPPSTGDFKPVSSASPESGQGFGGDAPPGEPPPEGAGKDLAATDDARFCVRVAAGQWVERRVRGRDARRLYRWIPGLDGSVTAIVLDEPGAVDKPAPTLRKRRAGDRDPATRAFLAAPAGSAPEASARASREPAKSDGAAAGKRAPRRPSEGVHIIHVDPAAASLQGGMFPALPLPMRSPPYRAIDADLWQDERDGAIRGWVVFPPESGEGPDAPHEPPAPEPAASGATAVKLPVSAQLGGRVAGVTIALDGTVTVHRLPAYVIEVVRGGRFALALAEKDDVTTTYESIDGGRSWRVVEGPPVGRIAAPYDAEAIHGCTEIGCTWGEGIVRLGWGGPTPSPPSAQGELAPAVGPLVRGPDPLALSCAIAADRGALTAPAGPGASPARPPSKPPGGKGAGKPAPPEPIPPPITLRTRPSSSLGTFRPTPGRGGSWSADVVFPFRPGAAPKKITLSDPELTPVFGSVVPLLRSSKAGGGDDVDLVLLTDRRRLPLGASGSKLLPFEYSGTIAAMIEDDAGGLYALDADRGVVLYARGGPARPLVRLTRIADVQRVRLTLGARRDGRGPAVVGVSTSSGEVFAGALDPARAEVGPLEALGGLSSLRDGGAAECRGRRSTHRFLVDIPVALTLTGSDGKRLDEGASVTATALIDGDRERLCIAGLELRLSPPLGQAELSASFGSKAGAVVRVGAKSTRAVCTIPDGAARAP